MESLDLEGIFWLDVEPAGRVAGRLKFTADDGAKLHLIGSFHDLMSRSSATMPPVRILGVAGNQWLTLERCYSIRRSIRVPDGDREVYGVSSVLSGAHLSDDNATAFSLADVRLRHLTDWVAISNIAVEYEYPQPHDDSARQIRITHTERPTSRHETPTGGWLELNFVGRFSPGWETVIAEEASIGIQFNQPVALASVRSFCTSLQDLVTIACYSPATLQHVTLANTGALRQLKLYEQWQDARARSKERVHNWQMLFTFEDIGGLDGISRWIDVADRFKVTIGYLMNHWYLPGLYAETRFLHSVIAAESFERIRRQKPDFAFIGALTTIANDAGVAEELVGDVSVWAREVKSTRNKKVVHAGLGGEVDRERLHWLAESLYVLVVICLLRESGVSDETLANVAQHDRFQWVARGLQRTT